MNWKKRIFFILFLIIVLLFSWFSNYNLDNFLNLETSKAIFWISLPVLLFSLIFSFLNDKYYKPWFKFSLYFYLFCIFISFLSFIKESDFGLSVLSLFILFFTILYSLISIGILIYGLFNKNKPENNK